MRRSYLSIKNHTGAGVKGGILLLSAMLAFATTACNQTQASDDEKDLTKYVDPYIGTDYHGHVFIGANVPFGAVQPGTTNYVKGWDWCSGYHYSDSIMTGFSQLHLSGTGIGDLGDVLITPFTPSCTPTGSNLCSAITGKPDFCRYGRCRAMKPI